MPAFEFNPFIYPGPVPVERFVGREDEIHSLLERIATGQNTAVVGEPNIGKSSLLQHLALSEDCHTLLGDMALTTLFVFHDCHLLPSTTTPAGFWHKTMSQLWQSCPNARIRQVVDWAAKGEFGHYATERVIQTISEQGWRLALLIDEFDSLLGHPGFNTAEFFGMLRSLATRFSGLALVTASRLSVAEMNRQSHQLNPFGSPFFNGFIEINLQPFSDQDVVALFEDALAGKNVVFDQNEREFVCALAGRHPFLLQVAAGALYKAKSSDLERQKCYLAAVDIFHHQTKAHFDDLWNHLSSRARIALTILCLGEVQGRVSGKEFNVNDIGALDRYSTELEYIANQGLVEMWKKDGWHVDWGNWVVWNGQRWRVTSRRLTWWVVDQIAAHEDVSWEKWITDNQYHGILTTEEIETLKKWTAMIPPEAIDTTVGILKLLLKELATVIL